MRTFPLIVASGAALVLSGCLAAPVIGPSKQAQDDAIFACAKEVGDQVFPLTSRVSTSLGAGGQSITVQVVATDRLSAAQAASINACAADRLAAASIDLAPAPVAAAAVAASPDPAGRSIAQGCPSGASVLYGGSGYCVRP